MKSYYELNLNHVKLWPTKDRHIISTRIFKWKIPILGGDAYSKCLSMGRKLSKYTKKRS